MDSGEDIVARIDGREYLGRGDLLRATGGDAQGLTLRFKSDPQSGFVSTVTDALGVAIVQDQSANFVLNQETGESVSFAFPDIRPETLGMHELRDFRFGSLQEIDISNLGRANDSLYVTDVALRELYDYQNEVQDFLEQYAYPYGSGSLTAVSGAEFALHGTRFFDIGENIGPDAVFVDADTVLSSSQAGVAFEQDGFLGVRMPAESGWTYGWVGVELGADSSLQIRDYAWNPTPDAFILAGRATLTNTPGDANSDGLVDFQDFLELSNHFGQRGAWDEGDFDADNLVGFSDFLVLSANFGTTTIATVPEGTANLPAAALLLAGCLGRIRRRSIEETGATFRELSVADANGR